MSSNDSKTFPRFPLSSDTEGNETASISTYEIFLSSLDLFCPRFAFGKFYEASLDKNGFGSRNSVEWGRRSMNKSNKFVGVASLCRCQGRHGGVEFGAAVAAHDSVAMPILPGLRSRDSSSEIQA